LPLKTSSYQKWTTKLTEYAQSPALLAEIPYWQEIEAKLPVSDHPAPSNGTTNQRFALSKEKTQQLTQEANAAYNTDVNILLLTAFSAVYKTQNDLKNVPLMLEGHGREAVVQHVDITRTTGWFTSMYPVVLETTISDDPGTQIKQVKETIRLVPSKGIGYGILKYLTKSSEALFSNDRQPAILFNYLGEFTSATGGDFTLAGESAGQTSDPEAGNGFSMNINAQIQEGQLEIAVNADPAIWKPETIEQVFTSCIEHLEKLIDHCCNRENTEVTYSDITSAEISSSEFESLFD
jgi:non-ribosomal peptide synthase protein (TIGR01720 family)